MKLEIPNKLPSKIGICEGADEGIRTHTPRLAETDFKSVASTIPPHRRSGVHSKLFLRPAKMDSAMRTDSDAA
jgi:hypothetical protein